jgi:hypothetical protein
MKIHLIALIAAATLLAGCSGGEETSSSSEASSAPESETPARMEATEAEPTDSAAGERLSGLADSLKAHADTVRTQVDKEVSGKEKEAAEAVAEAEAESGTARTDLVTEETDLPEYAMADQEARDAFNSQLQSEDAGSMMSSLSWDQVPDLPYADKDKLVEWANDQIADWKTRLTDSAMQQGTAMLANLGDSGWQGALKKVVEAIKGVRESSPETWEMARDTLITNWEQFRNQAMEAIGSQGG